MFDRYSNETTSFVYRVRLASFIIEKSCVFLVSPILSLLNFVFSFIFSSRFCHLCIVFFISLSFEFNFSPCVCHLVFFLCLYTLKRRYLGMFVDYIDFSAFRLVCSFSFMSLWPCIQRKRIFISMFCVSNIFPVRVLQYICEVSMSSKLLSVFRESKRIKKCLRLFFEIFMISNTFSIGIASTVFFFFVCFYRSSRPFVVNTRYFHTLFC